MAVITPGSSYQIGELRVYIDRQGNVTGDWNGRVDLSTGAVYDQGGNIVGNISSSYPGYPSFTTTTGQSAPVIRAGSSSPSSSSSSVLPSYLSPRTYIFGGNGGSVTISEDGKITGDFNGRIDPQGRVYDANKNFIGTVVSDFGGKPVFVSSSGQRAVMFTGEEGTQRAPYSPPSSSPTSSEAMAGSGQGESPFKGRWQIGDFRILVKPDGTIAGDFAGRVDPSGNVYDARGTKIGTFSISGENITFRNASGQNIAGTRLKVPKLTGSWQIGNLRISIDDANRVSGDFTGKINGLGYVLDSNGNKIGSILPGSDGSITFRNASGQTVSGTRLSSSSTQPSPTSPIVGGGGIGQSVLTGVESSDLPEVLSFLKGLLTESTAEFLGSRDVARSVSSDIARYSPGLEKIASDLEFLARASADKMGPVVHGPGGIEDLVRQYVSGIPGVRSAYEEGARKFGETVIPALTEALSRLRSAPYDFGAVEELGKLRGEITPEALSRVRGLLSTLGGQINTSAGLTGDLAGRLRDILAGRIELPQFMREDLERREQAARETLLRELGPGYATSTPGQTALSQIERFRQGVLDEFRTQELARALQGLASQQQATAQFSSLSGNLATAMPEIQGRLASLASAIEEARNKNEIAAAAGISSIGQELGRALAIQPTFMLEALRPYLEGAQAQGFLRGQYAANMADLIGSGRDIYTLYSQLAALKSMPISLRSGVAAQAIESLGKAALLPMTARGTALNLLNAAIGGEQMSLGGLLNLLPSPSAGGINTNIANLLAQLGTQEASARTSGIASAIGGGAGSLAGLFQNLGTMDLLKSIYGGGSTASSSLGGYANSGAIGGGLNASAITPKFSSGSY